MTVPKAVSLRARLYGREIMALSILSMAFLAYGVALASVDIARTLYYDDWDLVYYEPFDTEEALAEFDTRYIWPRSTIINNEQQYYVDPAKMPGLDNPVFSIDSGILSITAAPTPEEWGDEAQGQPFTSGLLTSRSNSHSQLFGLFEISAKLPKAAGSWPAFWLLPTFESWPPGIGVLSEIDVLEGVQGVSDGTYKASFHTNDTGALTSKTETVETGIDLTKTFNRYAVTWDPEFLVWYFNGKEVHRAETPQDMQGEPRHFLLNLAVGGWAGTPVLEEYPDSFEIDYVKVYTHRAMPPAVVAEEIKETPFTFEGVIRIIELLRDTARGNAGGV